MIWSQAGELSSPPPLAMMSWSPVARLRRDPPVDERKAVGNSLQPGLHDIDRRRVQTQPADGRAGILTPAGRTLAGNKRQHRQPVGGGRTACQLLL